MAKKLVAYATARPLKYTPVYEGLSDKQIRTPWLYEYKSDFFFAFLEFIRDQFIYHITYFSF